MSAKPKPSPSRGGSDTARLRGLKHVPIDLTPEQHLLLRKVAGAAGMTMKAFATAALLAAVEKSGK